MLTTKKTKVEVYGATSKYEKSMRDVRRISAQTSQGISKSWGGVTKSFAGLVGVVGALAGAIGGITLSRLTKDGIDTAAAFEQMEIKLNALTKGKGKETLDAINSWALDMPVNTEKAVDAFTTMTAYGLDPTLEKMETLVDVSSIFGEQALPSVSRALGQMAALGKLSAEELNQLSESGINARKYLKEAFGMTVEEVQKSGIAINEVIDVIWEGMNRDYGGAAREAMGSWQGLTAIIKSYYTEMKRLTMKAGPMDAMKMVLGEIVTKLDEARASGDMLAFAQKTGTGIIKIIAAVIEAIGWIPTAFYSVKEAIHKVLTAITAVADAIIHVGAISLTVANPVKLFQLSMSESTETFEEALRRVQPRLMGFKDEVAAFGVSQAQAGDNASTAAEKFANWGVEAERLAGKIQGVKIETEGLKEGLVTQIPEKPSMPGGASVPKEAGVVGPGAHLPAEYPVPDPGRWLDVYEERLEARKQFQEQYAAMGKTEYELEVERIQQQAELWKEAGANRIQLEEWTQAKLTEVRNQENQARLNDLQTATGAMASNFKMISEMGGKHSKEAFEMYKAFKIVESTIATYKSAVLAYSSLVGIPIIGPALASAAAASAVVFGMAQVAMIQKSQPPSYDQGGISTTPGIYYSGVPEAHIPLQSGGTVPVQISTPAKGGKQNFIVMLNNPVFQDLTTQRLVFAQIADAIAKKVAPDAIVDDYNNDGTTRSIIRGSF